MPPFPNEREKRLKNVGKKERRSRGILVYLVNELRFWAKITFKIKIGHLFRQPNFYYDKITFDGTLYLIFDHTTTTP
jgi:hypothetical protein